MITRKVKIIMFLVIAVTALSSSVIYAQPSDGDSKQEKVLRNKMEAKLEELCKDLNLTDEQKKLLKENKNKRREEMKTLLNEMKEKRSLMSQELQKAELNMERINQINNELKALEAQMLDHRLASILEVRKILTPEQFKKFMTKTEKRKEHFKNKLKGPKNKF